MSPKLAPIEDLAKQKAALHSLSLSPPPKHPPTPSAPHSFKPRDICGKKDEEGSQVDADPSCLARNLGLAFLHCAEDLCLRRRDRRAVYRAELALVPRRGAPVFEALLAVDLSPR